MTAIEEVTFWINSAREILKLIPEHNQMPKVLAAIQDIMNFGRPGYQLQSEAYRHAFGDFANFMQK